MDILRLSAATLLAGCLIGTVTPAAQSGPPFDLVISGGRVIDPESQLDAVMDVGVTGDRITAISATPIAGKDRIDASGLVVSPGFIDLHRHAVGENSYRYAARDGVTSVFELEIGTPDVDAWYRMMGPARLINFGVGAGHIGARMAVMGDRGFLLPIGPARGVASREQVERVLAQIDRGLSDGGVAVGIGIAYTPGIAPEEIEGSLRLAVKYHTFVVVHAGGGGFAELRRLLQAGATAGAPIHLAHINSTAGDEVRSWLQVVRDARRSGQDVTTEVYPYTAGASLIQSALFDDWQTWPDGQFAQMQWAATGERLTRDTFAKYRALGGSVISHSNTEESLRVGMADPLPIFASDGGRDLDDNPTHPRAAGTFARVVGRYVRDERVLSLNDALRRMTIEPARRLEARVPEMKDRGRIRLGAFADITVFDPATVTDRATYTDAAEFSAGIRAVVVNGVAVVRDSDFVTEGTLQGQRVRLGSPMPGRPIRAPR
ncbi:MAG: amidohydrolase family protein [Vicinamibacterales bacterium]